MRSTLTPVLVLLAGCATMHHTAGQPMQVSAVATPAGVSQVIMTDAQAELIRAQAVCLSNPASCGWMTGYGFTPYPSVDPTTAAANAWYLWYTGATAQQDIVGASVVLNQQMVRDLEAARSALEQSRVDFQVAAEAVATP